MPTTTISSTATTRNRVTLLHRGTRPGVGWTQSFSSTATPPRPDPPRTTPHRRSPPLVPRDARRSPNPPVPIAPSMDAPWACAPRAESSSSAPGTTASPPTPSTPTATDPSRPSTAPNSTMKIRVIVATSSPWRCDARTFRRRRRAATWRNFQTRRTRTRSCSR